MQKLTCDECGLEILEGERFQYRIVALKTGHEFHLALNGEEPPDFHSHCALKILNDDKHILRKVGDSLVVYE